MGAFFGRFGFFGLFRFFVGVSCPLALNAGCIISIRYLDKKARLKNKGKHLLFLAINAENRYK